jgi:5-methylcytosine-specific restriction endonuclease McrA
VAEHRSNDSYLRERYAAFMRRYPRHDTATLLVKRALRAIIWDKTKGRCWYCGELTNPFSNFAIDHFIPRDSGGDESYDNLVPCCRTCNSIKNNVDIERFREIMAGKRLPLFTEEQKRFLEESGVNITLPSASDHAFYFEKEHLDKSGRENE